MTALLSSKSHVDRRTDHNHLIKSKVPAPAYREPHISASTLSSYLYRSMLKCCPICPRTSSTSSGLTRHHLACKIYQRYLNDSLRTPRLEQETARLRSMVRKTNVLQAEQHDVEEANTELKRNQTDNTFNITATMTTVSSAIPTHGNYHNYHGYVS